MVLFCIINFVSVRCCRTSPSGGSLGVLRTTFVIDAEGRIEKIFTKVDTKNHYRQIIDSYK